MVDQTLLFCESNGGAEDTRRRPLAAGMVLMACLALPTVATARETFVCSELKAAVADAERGFAAHKGALNPQAKPSPAGGKTYLVKKPLTGAASCSVVDVNMDEPTMRLRQTAYSCQFPGVSRLDKALRAELTRCVAGEVDDSSDPDELTIWVDRVSSGEGYRGVEVNAQANGVNGLTLQVRQSVCTNKGNGLACEE